MAAPTPFYVDVSTSNGQSKYNTICGLPHTLLEVLEFLIGCMLQSLLTRTLPSDSGYVVLCNVINFIVFFFNIGFNMFQR